MSGNMRADLIKSLNGKLKDGIKAGDIVDEVISNISPEKTSYTAKKFKISEENAIKELERILDIYEIAEISEKDGRDIINKIKFGKIYLKNEKVMYKLSNPIERGSGPEYEFCIERPLQASFEDNDVDIIQIATMLDRGGSLEKGIMSKTCTIFLNIPEAFSKKLTVGDTFTIFTVGMLLFFG